MKDIESRKIIGKLVCVLRNKNIIDEKDMEELFGKVIEIRKIEWCCDEPDCKVQPHFTTNAKGLPRHCTECGTNCLECDIYYK